MVLVFGVGMYVALDRVYEMDPVSLSLLVSQTVLYAGLLGVTLGLSGRIGFGASVQVYLALTVLAALAHNLRAGGQG